MEQLIDSYTKSKNLHHAYFLVGDMEKIFLKLRDFLEKSLKIKTSGNPDFWHGKFDNLTIDNARDITESSNRKSFEKNPSSRAELATGLRVFIIQTNSINHEAQNSLLKVFEEPTVGTHFFIISPQDVLLPTLRSRMQVVFHNSELKDDSKSIFSMSFKDRLEKVKEITEAIKDEEKTKQDAIALLNQIERELYDKGVEKSSDSLKLCELTRKSLYDRGAPVKIILENLMLTI